MGRVVAGGVAGAVATGGRTLQLLAVVLTAAAERIPSSENTVSLNVWPLSTHLPPPLPRYQLGLEGSVPSEKTSFQSAFPVLCAIYCSLF